MEIQIIHYGKDKITSETILSTEEAAPKKDKYGYPLDPNKYDEDGYPLDEEGIPYDPEAEN